MQHVGKIQQPVSAAILSVYIRILVRRGNISRRCGPQLQPSASRGGDDPQRHAQVSSRTLRQPSAGSTAPVLGVSATSLRATWPAETQRRPLVGALTCGTARRSVASGVLRYPSRMLLSLVSPCSSLVSTTHLSDVSLPLPPPSPLDRPLEHGAYSYPVSVFRCMDGRRTLHTARMFWSYLLPCTPSFDLEDLGCGLGINGQASQKASSLLVGPVDLGQNTKSLERSTWQNLNRGRCNRSLSG